MAAIDKSEEVTVLADNGQKILQDEPALAGDGQNLSDDMKALAENGQNKEALTCKYCPSRILNPKVGQYVRREFSLPRMTHKKNQSAEEADVLQDFWRINDMFQFENIGFSNTVDGVKYLTCADCEMGPVGWHDLGTKESFISVSRVRNA